MRYSPFALVLIGLTVAGCAAQQQRAMVKQTTSCLQAAYNSPEAAPIRARTPFNATDASLAQLGDKSLASQSEAAAVATVWPRVQGCDRQLVATLTTAAPTIAPIFEKAYAANEDDALALMQRKMTWGDFNRRRRDRSIASREALLAEQSHLAAESHAREQALNQSLATAAIISAASQPRVTFPPAPSVGHYCYNYGSYSYCP